MTTIAAIPVPPRIVKDIENNDARAIKLFLENVKERLSNIETRLATIEIKLSVVASTEDKWAIPTGTSTRDAYDTATVTTAELAERVRALIEDLSDNTVLTKR